MVVNGFVDNMPQWMTACDTIVTKAGPGTIVESLICGLPVLLNGFVPCQEAGNVPFVIDNKVGPDSVQEDPGNSAPRLLQCCSRLSERAIFLGRFGALFRDGGHM